MGMSIASPPIPEYVELACGRRGYQPRPAHLVHPNVCLALLTVALGYAAFRTGGVEFSDWNLSLLLVGFASVLYLLRTRSLPLLSSPSCWIAWMTILLPAYVAFQLLPLPLWLLGVLSPERARLADSLAAITGSSAFASLSINPANSASLLLTLVGYVLVFLVVRDVAARLTDSVLWGPAIPLILIGATEAGIGLIQAASDGDVLGTYGSWDHFAGLLEMILPFAVMYGILNVRRESELTSLRLSNACKACVAFVAAVLLFLAALYSTSRMGTVATIGGLLVMGAFAVHSRQAAAWRKAASIVFLAIVALLVLVYFSPNTLISRFGGLLVGEESRWPIWRNTFSLIRAFPLFGCGLGNFGTAFVRFQTADLQNDYEYAHNDYLQLISELGIIGFFIFGTLIFFICRAVIRATSKALDRRARYLGLACIGALAAIGLHSLADFNLYVPANAFVLAWIAGIATRGNGTHDERLGTAQPSRGVAIAAGGFVIAYASAWLLFNTAFESDRKAEHSFCRFGICDTESVLAAETLQHANVAPQSALIEALSRDSASPLRWTDLGDAFLRSKELARARYCFSHAEALAPRVPPVLMRVANFYYNVGETRRGLQRSARILASADPGDPNVFDSFNANRVPVIDVLEYGMPSDARAPQAYLRYLMSLGDLANTATVWNWLVSHYETDERTATEYANFLFGQQQYAFAANAWASYLGPHRNGYLQSDWIYDGGFEGDRSTSSLDWQIEKLPHVEMATDATVVHSGHRSLRIAFDGKENVSFNHVSQTVFVQPGHYKFQAYVRCEGITADQGVGFQIFDPENPASIDLKTPQLVGNHGWTEIEEKVSIRPGTRLLRIQLIRQPSWKLFDNNTTGTLWIDDVQLLKIN
jgi:O-antigen ligase